MRIRSFSILLALAVLLFASACKQQPTPVTTLPQPTAMDFFNDGLNYYNSAQYGAAAQAFENAVAMMPSMVDAHYYRGMCYVQQGQSMRAEEAFRAALRYNPNHLLTREALGQLYFTTGRPLPAKAELETARALNSVNPTVYLYLGKLYLAERNCKDAILSLEHALRLNPGYAEAQMELSRAKSVCRSTPKPATPKVREEKSFKGGAKALDPSEF
ncbi:tetratricopeptide repeat protein [Megalodesulfovibrio paquesii]